MHGVKKGYASNKPISEMYLISDYIQTNHKKDRCNHTSK